MRDCFEAGHVTEMLYIRYSCGRGDTILKNVSAVASRTLLESTNCSAFLDYWHSCL